jgi:hypothetical protein
LSIRWLYALHISKWVISKGYYSHSKVCFVPWVSAKGKQFPPLIRGQPCYSPHHYAQTQITCIRHEPPTNNRWKKRTELHYIMFVALIFSFLCCVFCVAYLSPVFCALCAQCCQLLWLVHSGLPLRLSLTWKKTYRTSLYNVCSADLNVGATQPCLNSFCDSSWALTRKPLHWTHIPYH